MHGRHGSEFQRPAGTDGVVRCQNIENASFVLVNLFAMDRITQSLLTLIMMGTMKVEAVDVK
jgi:hypothetical protein